MCGLGFNAPAAARCRHCRAPRLSSLPEYCIMGVSAYCYLTEGACGDISNRMEWCQVKCDAQAWAGGAWDGCQLYRMPFLRLHGRCYEMLATVPNARR